MKIQNTKDIRAFFERCKSNMIHDTKNDFLGLKVTKDNEKSIQRKMKKAGFQEFDGPESTWPSLFLSTDDFISNPYHQNIRIEQIEDDNIRLSSETILSNQLFNLSGIIFDKDKELNDWMMLRALDKPYQATVLMIDQQVWMLDVPGEAHTMDPIARKAHGDILVFGLGIGYYIYMAMLNPQVTSITVIERSSSIIDLFNKHLLPHFPQNISLQIICGDAFDHFHKEVIERYDHVFVDIYQSSEDGYQMIEKMLMKYLPTVDKVDFWIENSCFEFLPALILLYFEAITFKEDPSHDDPFYQHMFDKIHQHFKKIDTVVYDVPTLKDMMYDRDILRTISSVIVD